MRNGRRRTRIRVALRGQLTRTGTLRSPCDFLVLAAVSFLAGGGCRCGGDSSDKGLGARAPSIEDGGVVDLRKERVIIERVVVEEQEPVATVEIYPRMVAQELARTLTETPWFEAELADVSPAWRPRPATLTVRVGHELVDDGRRGHRRGLLVTVEALLAWTDGREDLAPAERIALEHDLEESETASSDGDYSEALVATISREVHRGALLAAHGLIAQEALRSGDETAVIEALGADDPSLQAFAIAVVRSRKLAAAREPLERLVDAEDVDRGAVVGALVAIGNPRSVSAITRLPTEGNLELQHTAIEAVAVLGGEDAHAYLEFVATGHPDADVRQHAAAALIELNERAPPP